MKTKHFLQQLFLWTLIILIAWFVFSGGIGKVYNHFKYGDKLTDQRTDYSDFSLTGGGISCDLYKLAMKEDSEYTNFMMENQCDLLCLMIDEQYEDYICQDNKMRCLCSEK